MKERTNRIGIDLTPLLPGGANGGAKIMTLELIKNMAGLSPNYQFILFGTPANFPELSSLKTNNIQAKILKTKIKIKHILLSFFYNPKLILKFVKQFLLHGAILSSQHLATQLKKNILSQNLAKSLKIDLLFCPFTAPYYHLLKAPIVSVIYDIQSIYYPFFFTPAEQIERKRNFEDACSRATKLICISNYVKNTVIEKSKVNKKNIETIYIRLAHRLPQVELEEQARLLSLYNLNKEQFLLYPANFWAHKNHKMLFTAFNIYRSNNPTSKLKLVCTGAESSIKNSLKLAISEMGLNESIILPGFLSDTQFATLLINCRAVIFPSLYEGFGMPLLEAMAAGKPVISSNTTSLPEIAGDAALFFDPRKPTEISNAIFKIENDPELREKLISNGYKRVAEFGSSQQMAAEYLKIFETVLTKGSKSL